LTFKLLLFNFVNRGLGRPQTQNGHFEGGGGNNDVIFKTGLILNQTLNEKTSDKFQS